MPIAICEAVVKRQIYVRAETQPDFRKNMERIRDAPGLTYVSIKGIYDFLRKRCYACRRSLAGYLPREPYARLQKV